MALTSGFQLGPYAILAPLGAGGMGEVYRARDSKLGRDVALKVLPEAFAADPERMARFQREAKAMAALNHPHIVTIPSEEAAPPLIIRVTCSHFLELRSDAEIRRLHSEFYGW
jgi:serine/threonine protein kinase